MKISFIVNGEPMAKQRPRVSTYGGFARAYTPKETINYENKVLMCYKEALKELDIDDTKVLFPNGFIKITLKAYFGLTKADFGKKGLNKNGRNKIENVYCAKKCDIDNIVKIVMDSLNGICYNDDSQAVCIEAYKLYTQEQARVEVTFNEITPITS